MNRKYKKMLTPDVLAKADLPPAGSSSTPRLLSVTCSGEGHKIGPDLTGSDRGNLHYIIENSGRSRGASSAPTIG